MALFKKGDDILDLTLLQKKGLLKISPEVEENIEDEYTDLTPPAPNIEPPTSSFDFLDSLANASASSTPTPTPTPTYPQNTLSSADLQDINVKIENLEYKLDRFLERIEKLESRLTD